MSKDKVEFYLSARDLDGLAIGNHQFIVIYLSANLRLQRIKAELEDGQCFVTLAADYINPNLVFLPNLKSDVQAVKENLNPYLSGTVYNYSIEKHKIKPVGDSWAFALLLEKLAYNYERNTKGKAVKYSLSNCNCASWTNTLLKVAGISQEDRLKLSEFKGTDWGEEDLLNEKLFAD